MASSPFIKSCDCGFLFWKNKNCPTCNGTGTVADQHYFTFKFQYELELAGLVVQDAFLPRIEAGIRELSSFPHLRKDYVTNSLYFDRGLILLDMYKAKRNATHLKEARASFKIVQQNGGNHIFSDDFLIVSLISVFGAWHRHYKQ